MTFFRTLAIGMAALGIFAACSHAPKTVKPQEVPNASRPLDLNRGGTFYSSGITFYEEGEYDLAEKNLKMATALGLADPKDNRDAHKYLAFIYCVSDRQSLCRNEFIKVFEIDPGFTLSPAESGHPMWQPVYDKVKSQMSQIKKTP